MTQYFLMKAMLVFVASHTVNILAQNKSSLSDIPTAYNEIGLYRAPSAQTALHWLQKGNQRYTKSNFRKDGLSSKDRTRLAKGQHPHSIILSCADSRVPPEIVFDQKPGELFTVRSAGQALDSVVLASLEYAVEHLGSKLLVIMGHTSCGAIHAALDTLPSDPTSSQNSHNLSPNLEKLVQDIHPRLKNTNPKARSAKLEAESSMNAKAIAHDLIRRSEIIKKKIEGGALTIVPALYYLESGEVKFLK